MNAKNFSDRLDFAISKVGNIGDVVKAANISYTTISRWKEGSDPKMSNLVTLAEIANVNLDWLMTGKGTPDGTTDGTAAQHTIDNGSYDYLPYYDQAASAGHGVLVAEDETSTYLAFPKWWSRQRGLKAQDLCGLNAKGDSMEPTIPDGSILILDRSKIHPMDGKIYVIRVDGELYVKRVQRLPTGIRLISDNTDYSTFDIPKVDLNLDNYLQVIGQVVHIGIDLPH